jgi:flagellar hook-basal body complex protein FliE
MIPPITPPVFTPTPAASGAVGGGTDMPSFAQELKGAVQQMEALHSDANAQIGQLIHGTSEDVHASMIAVEKSDLAFGLMLQLRNKAVEAYQDIAHMQF